MNPRKYTLKSETKILLGKNETNNDELVKKFQGKDNFILHTAKPGSGFCVIDSLEPIKQDIKQAAVICAAKSQDWRDNKKSVKMHLFTGKDVSKPRGSKLGSWTLKNRPKKLKIKRKEIKRWLSEKSS